MSELMGNISKETNARKNLIIKIATSEVKNSVDKLSSL